MSGIQVHTSSPINANAEGASDVQTNPLGSGNAANDTATLPPPPPAETPSKTISANVIQRESIPPPPLPGQTPSVQNTIAPAGQQAYAGQSTFMPANSAATHQPPAPVRQDLSNPPGYQQQQNSFQGRPVMDEHSASVFSSTSVRPSGGILNTGSMNASSGEESPIWDTAKSWAKAAGQKLSTTEATVWKMVNGEK